MSIFERTAGAAFLLLVLALAPASAADRRAVTMPVPGQPYFVQLDPMFVPVLASKNMSRQVSIAVAVEIADGAQAKDVEQKRPELGDAFLGAIYAYVQQRDGIGDATGEVALKDLLRGTAARILDPIEVKEVEIEVFFEQRR
jgi:flagellar basal body-associated protein FliL